MASTTPLPDDRAALELRRLRAEVSSLERSQWRNPTLWVTLAALLPSVLGNVLQYSAAARDRQLAQIQKEQIELDTAKTEMKLQALQAEVKAKTAALEGAKHELEDQLRRLEAVRKEADLVMNYKAKLSADLHSLAQRAEGALRSVNSGLLWGNVVAEPATPSGSITSDIKK